MGYFVYPCHSLQVVHCKIGNLISTSPTIRTWAAWSHGSQAEFCNVISLEGTKHDDWEGWMTCIFMFHHTAPPPHPHPPPTKKGIRQSSVIAEIPFLKNPTFKFKAWKTRLFDINSFPIWLTINQTVNLLKNLYTGTSIDSELHFWNMEIITLAFHIHTMYHTMYHTFQME